MITCDPRIRSGWPCIAGTRLGVEIVAEDIQAGQQIEQYALDKGITVAEVNEALEVYKGLLPLFAGAAVRVQPTASLVFTLRKRAGWLEGENRSVNQPRPARDMDHAQLMRSAADRIEALELELATARARAK